VSATRFRSVAITILLWAYFTGAFLAGYWVVFLFAGILRGRRGLGWALRSYTRGFIAVVGWPFRDCAWRFPSGANCASPRAPWWCAITCPFSIRCSCSRICPV
jgi:hypothetical protein